MSRTLHDVASGTLFGVALNYQGLLDQHLAAFQQAPYQKPPTKPVLFIKTPNTRNAHGGIVLQQVLPCGVAAGGQAVVAEALHMLAQYGAAKAPRAAVHHEVHALFVERAFLVEGLDLLQFDRVAGCVRENALGGCV